MRDAIEVLDSIKLLCCDAILLLNNMHAGRVFVNDCESELQERPKTAW